MTVVPSRTSARTSAPASASPARAERRSGAARAGAARAEVAARERQPDGATAPGGSPRVARAPIGVAGWLVSPLLLSATLAAALLVMRGADRLFAWALCALFAVALTWVLVSVFFPASVDRTCPECGQPALERLDPETTRGLGCAACGHRDATASSFLMAESEGTFEEAVLRERRTARERARKEPAP